MSTMIKVEHAVVSTVDGNVPVSPVSELMDRMKFFLAGHQPDTTSRELHTIESSLECHHNMIITNNSPIDAL